MAGDVVEPAMRRHDEIIEKAIASQSGEVVKKTGDGFMAVFANPKGAVSAAVESQRTLGAEAWEAAIAAFTVRIGIHTGSGQLVNGDYLGSTNKAARIEAAGHGGQILVSAATGELVDEPADLLGYRDLGDHYLRGLSHPERLYQVTGDGLMEDFPPIRTE
jgi:class 3 adenylate cyclase